MKRNEFTTKAGSSHLIRRVNKNRWHHEMYLSDGILFAISSPSADTKWFNFKGYEVFYEFGAGSEPPTIIGDE